MASICWRLVPTAVALSAFVLTILTLFSGDKPGVLTHNDILTVGIMTHFLVCRFLDPDR